MDTGNTRAWYLSREVIGRADEHALEEFRHPVSVLPQVGRDRSTACESAEC